MVRNDEMLLKMIQECIRNQRYQFTTHALTKHPPLEGFEPLDGLRAILNGEIIEHDASRARCVICGEVPGLECSSTYITSYLHCVCDYDEGLDIVIVTMYRPTSDRWINHFTRREGN